MRLFLAVRLPDAVVDSLDHALVAPREAYPDLRWVPRERWHLTLAFFGEVPQRQLPALVARLARKIARSGEMSLRLSGAGRFGDRVLWIGVQGDGAGDDWPDGRNLPSGIEALQSLARRVAVDDRPYRPHLTVARSRHHTNLRPVVEEFADYAGPLWLASDVELIESRLGPRPTYETIEKWPLPSRTSTG